jgi:hypothetical protein
MDLYKVLKIEAFFRPKHAEESGSDYCKLLFQQLPDALRSKAGTAFLYVMWLTG